MTHAELRLIAVLAAVVSCGAVVSPCAQSEAAAVIVARLHDYLDAYEPKLSAIVADEVFEQRHQFRPKFARLRRLEEHYVSGGKGVAPRPT